MTQDPTTAIVGHDAAGNALGRALALADLFEGVGPVEVTAFGRRVWSAAGDQTRVRLLEPPRTNAGLIQARRRLAKAVQAADILVAVKPRALSFGLLACVRRGRPLILDIDDLEHAFVRHRAAAVRQLVTPDHLPVTRFLERWRPDGVVVTVASRALQRRYGGHFVPHVRDRDDLLARGPSHGVELRRRLGLEGHFVVGFVGTVRPHKGLRTAAAAVALLGPDAHLLIAGDGDPNEIAAVLAAGKGAATIVPGPTMAELRTVLGAIDVAIIPQADTVASRYQSPAKLLDAMAAGLPIVASDIGDAREVVGQAGILVPPDDAAAFAAALREVRNAERRVALGEMARARYRERFGLETWREVIRGVVAEALVRR